jgi:ribonuclease T2
MISRLFYMLCVLLIASPVWAQANGEQKGAVPGTFDFYVLALSWSPTYCANGGDKRSPDQCHSGSSNGFVIHGLWPQLDHGYPTECPSEQADLPKTTLEPALRLFPDLKLAEREWKRHGTCTARAPADYLADISTARQKVTIPAPYQRPRMEALVSPLDLQNAFIDANPGLAAGMMEVSCVKGELQEVRICFTKDLKGFRACPEVVAGSCRAKSVTMLPVP